MVENLELSWKLEQTLSCEVPLLLNLNSFFRSCCSHVRGFLHYCRPHVWESCFLLFSYLFFNPSVVLGALQGFLVSLHSQGLRLWGAEPLSINQPLIIYHWPRQKCGQTIKVCKIDYLCWTAFFGESTVKLINYFNLRGLYYAIWYIITSLAAFMG